ncbi:SH3 domain-containing protein [Sporomusa aerivorans]|uniref:SH3 domain-containing protein n=1 Tax=Sporomusa aerivorans TaxID=204936 RepID=UPI00352A4E49
MKKVQLVTAFFLLLLTACTVLPAQAVFSAVTNTDKVKIYSEPTDSATVLAVLKRGDVVKVHTKSADGQYWEVDHKGTHGWIIFKYLSPRDPSIETKHW